MDSGSVGQQMASDMIQGHRLWVRRAGVVRSILLVRNEISAVDPCRELRGLKGVE